MTADLGLWLEAASGHNVPPDCYAAVRQGEAKGPVPPTYCVPHKVSCLGRAAPGGGPAVVDIFQRVGSVRLGSVEPGALVEATLDWPGRPEVRLRIAVVPVGQGTEVPVLAQLPQVATLPEVSEETRNENEAGLLEHPEELLPPPLQLPPLEKETEAISPIALEPISPPLPVSPTLRPMVENTEKFYKPISLNNCDQILPCLYLGGVQAVADTQSVVEQGIRAVCCCCRELEFPSSDWCQDLVYFRVDVEDMGAEPIDLYFPEAAEFIHSWVSREQPVLVHCRAGVSRSASVVIAYLIAYQGYTLHDAFFLVRSHRSIVTPNLGFMEKLGDFEEAQRGHEPTIEINKYESWYTSPERAAVPDLKPD
mmetsp:Transcript_64901/g.193428  ORF Transcript_64901/g.193428 Transcript_64901/m.193428 type:complete len:366 (-) Transcript_64901:95-1192(-)